MQITRITMNNEEYFTPFLPDTADYDQPNLLRLGVVTDDGEAAGAIAAFIDESIIEFISIYIQKEHRRAGYGRALVDALIDLAAESEDEYTAICAYFPDKPAFSEFFEKTGFDIFYDSSMYQIRLGEVIRSERCRKLLLKNNAKGIRNVSSLSEAETRLFTNFLLENNVPPMGYYDPDWSSVLFDDGRVSSVMLRRATPDKVEVLWFGTEKNDSGDSAKHIIDFIQKMEDSEIYDNSTPIVFLGDDTKLIESLDYLMGGSIHIGVVEKYHQALMLLDGKETETA